MNMLSCSTLHHEYLPQEYQPYIKPLWCGFGQKSMYYTSSLLTPYIDRIKIYIQDIRLYQTQYPTSHGIEYHEEKESIEALQNMIEAGRSTAHSPKKEDADCYKYIALLYLLEEQEQSISSEYHTIAEQVTMLQHHIPDIATLAPPHYERTLHTILPQCIPSYCTDEDTILVIHHEADIKANGCDELPSYIKHILTEYNLLSYVKGYQQAGKHNEEARYSTAYPLLFLNPHP